MALSNQPPNFRPFNTIIVGSNTLINSYTLLIVGNNISPLFIGKSEKSPVIWLNVVQDESWFPLIINNQTFHKDSRVSIDTTNKSVSVFVATKLILTAKLVNPESCKIDQLDLRPIGINCFMKDESLIVGNVTFSRSKFENVFAMAAIPAFKKESHT